MVSSDDDGQDGCDLVARVVRVERAHGPELLGDSKRLKVMWVSESLSDIMRRVKAVSVGHRSEGDTRSDEHRGAAAQVQKEGRGELNSSASSFTSFLPAASDNAPCFELRLPPGELHPSR